VTSFKKKEWKVEKKEKKRKEKKATAIIMVVNSFKKTKKN
jgi:hypothetical protein